MIMKLYKITELLWNHILKYVKNRCMAVSSYRIIDNTCTDIGSPETSWRYQHWQLKSNKLIPTVTHPCLIDACTGHTNSLVHTVLDEK